MEKAKRILAELIEKEIGEPVFDIEYDLSKSSVLMRVWRDEWYLTGNSFTKSGNRICFYSSLGIRQIIKGNARAKWSKREQSILIHS